MTKSTFLILILFFGALSYNLILYWYPSNTKTTRQKMDYIVSNLERKFSSNGATGGELCGNSSCMCSMGIPHSESFRVNIHNDVIKSYEDHLVLSGFLSSEISQQQQSVDIKWYFRPDRHNRNPVDVLAELETIDHPERCKQNKICSATLNAKRDVFDKCPSKRIDGLIQKRWNAALHEEALLERALKISPGSVAQVLLPASGGWPTKQLVGVCKLAVFEESHSSTSNLFEMYSKSWEKRLSIAVQLLDLANFLTDNNDGLIVYIHRLNPYDFEVDKNGNVVLSNLERVVIVDRKTTKESSSEATDTPVYTEAPNKAEELGTWEEAGICEYRYPDVNYQYVCQNILGGDGGDWIDANGKRYPGGLLHDASHQLERDELVSELYVLLDLCVRGSEALLRERRTSWVRAIAAARLRIHLDSLRKPCDQHTGTTTTTWCSRGTRFPDKTELTTLYRFQDWFGQKLKVFR